MDVRLNLDIPLHPVSKTWVLSALAIATLESMDFINPLDLVFLVSKLGSQPWRLVSSFCYFGPLSVHILHNLMFIARTFNIFEGSYMLDMHCLPSRWTSGLNEASRSKLQSTIEAHKTADFAHFTLRVVASIVTVVILLSRFTRFPDGFFLLGPHLGNASVYIACRKSPNVYFPLLGVNVKAQYAPFLTTAFEFLLSREFEASSFWPLSSVPHTIKNLLFSSYMGETVVVMALAHMWWYIQFFYLESIHNQFGTASKDERRAAYNDFDSFSWLDIPDLFRYIIAPPWYYLITKKLKALQVASEVTQESRQPETQPTQEVTNRAGSSNSQEASDGGDPEPAGTTDGHILDPAHSGRLEGETPETLEATEDEPIVEVSGATGSERRDTHL